jgi:hypothetical protein
VIVVGKWSLAGTLGGRATEAIRRPLADEASDPTQSRMILSIQASKHFERAMAGRTIFYLRLGYGSLLKWLWKTAAGIAVLAIFFAICTVTLDTLGCSKC